MDDLVKMDDLTKFRTKILEIDINEQDNFQVEKAKLEQE